MAGKRKILLMSDDIRMHSGIATQSKEFVMGTIDHYDWVQIGGAVKHPEEGKIIDTSEAANNERKIKDAYLKIYPVSGYGNPDILRQVMDIENQMLYYILQIQDFGFGFIIWNMKFVNLYLFFIIIYGMIYQILNIIETFIEVPIYSCQYQSKHMD